MLIARRRPSVVFGSNPSLVLACLLLLLKRVFRYRFVTDAHYAGIMAPGGSRFFQKVLDFCNQRADLVIVTNEQHFKHVEALGGRAFVCEDPLPDIQKYAAYENEQEKKVFFICSFDVDEPYLEAFQAANALHREGYLFFVSGNFSKARIRAGEWPQVRFLGYLPDADFYSHLADSQVVVDLTTQENCLVCGGYEAMALEKPLVTSKTFALQRYFSNAAVFVDHAPESIANGIRAAYRQRKELQRRIRHWKRDAVTDNATKLEAIRALLQIGAPQSGESVNPRARE
jgi:glycosyltransferase involved in cell wall biosynthesis